MSRASPRQDAKAGSQTWGKRLRRVWTDPVGATVIAAALLWLLDKLGAYLAGWTPVLTRVSTWLGGTSEVSNRSLVILAAVSALVALAVTWYTLVRRYKARAHAPGELAISVKAAFEPFKVLDEKFGIQWHIVKPPDEWLDSAPSPSYDASFVDGPFHATPECLQRLDVGYRHGEEGQVSPRCPRCKRELFAGGGMPWRSSRAAVIEELRRRNRRGQPIEAGIVLEHVNYWNGIYLPRYT